MDRAGAIETGEWDWARTEVRAGLDEATSEEERVLLLNFLAQLMVEGGERVDAEIDEVERWLTAHVAEEPHLQSSLSGIRSTRALQGGNLAAAAAGLLEGGRLDPFNAVGSFTEATLLALLARDRGRAEASLEALRATGSHAAMAQLVAQAGDAGIAALDGRAATARGGLLAAYAEFRDLGAVRRQALTGLVMATLLGADDALVRAAIDESRRLPERMGAGLWLARLDATIATSTGSAAPAVPAAERAALLTDA